MTLPEVCDCNERPENMPNTTCTTTTTTSPSTLSTSGAADNQTQTLGEALKTLLQQASAQGRVTCSLTSSVDLLSTCPDDVMLCVMPLLPHPDAAATIQSTLIRAVCLEHNIRVLSVDCDVKLAKTVVGSAAGEVDDGMEARGGAMMMMSEDEEEEEEEEVDDNCNKVVKASSACCDDSPLFFTGCDNLAPVMGFPCVLVRYPVEGTSKEDEVVAEFCKEQLFGHAQQDPYIELPD